MGRRILLVGADRGAALAAVRSLGRSGHSVILGTHDRESPCLASRFAREQVDLPDPLAGAGAFAGRVIAAVTSHRPDLLLPLGDEVIPPLLAVRSELERICPLAVCGTDAYMNLDERWRLLETARASGLEVPASLNVGSLDEVEAVLTGFSFPLTLWPAAPLAWVEGRGVRREVRRATDPESLLRAVEEMLPRGRVLIEPELSPPTVGIAFLCARGGLVTAFQQRALHEQAAAEGRGASYRVSEALDPDLLADGMRLLSGLSFTGPAELDFRADGDRRVLVDARGRLGDALPLAVAAGVDLPPMVVELMVGADGEELAGRRPAGEIRYRAGIYMRNLRPDLGWFGAAFRGELPAGTPSPWMEIARGKLRLLSGRERVNGAGDPGPAWAELGRIGRRLRSIAHRRSLSLLLRVWHLLAGPRPAMSTARRILVVCDGNICRSPFAAALLAARLEDLEITVESAGLTAALGHPAPPLARAAAERHGVSLAAHRSRPLAAEMVAAADLILVMDLEQERRILELHPGAAGKLELLGRHGPGRLDSPEIADPVTGDARMFDRVYARVAAAAERVAEWVRAGAGDR